MHDVQNACEMFGKRLAWVGGSVQIACAQPFTKTAPPMMIFTMPGTTSRDKRFVVQAQRLNA